MKKLLLLLLFTVMGVIAYSQTSMRTALTANIYATSGTSPYFNLQIIVADDLSRFDATFVTSGDYIYVLDGSFCWELEIDSVIFQSGNLLQIQVYDRDSTLSIVPNGQAAIVSTYPNYDLPFYVSSLREDLQSCVLQKLVERIDAIAGSGMGQNNIGSNLGTGEEIYAGKQDSVLEFKSLISGDNINIASNSTEITINSNPTLSYINDTLSISNGNSVILPFDSIYNEIMSQIGVVDTTRQKIYLPAHGFVLPTKGYIPINSEFDLAKSLDIDSTQIGYIIGIPHPDSIEFITGGVISVLSHGLTVGTVYYLNDDGTEDGTDNGTVSSVTAFPLDDNTISLREIGIINNRYMSIRPIPSSILTVNGTNPLNPSDSIVGAIINNIYKPLGLAPAGTIFTTPYSGASNNPRYQNSNPVYDSYNPSNAWIYDGRGSAVRLKEKLFALNLQDSSFSSQTLTPISCTTDSCAIEWFSNNSDKKFPNMFLGYIIGSGTINNPEHVWIYTDNHNNNFDSGVIRLKGDIIFVTPTELADSIAQIRSEIPTDINIGNSDLTVTTNRTLTVPNGYRFDIKDQGGGNNFWVWFSNRNTLTGSKPGFFVQTRDSVSSQYSSLYVLPDSTHLFTNKLKLEGDTITVTADRIRLNAADTRIQQVTKDNALNRVMMLDSLTGQVYYRDVSSIAGGGGTVTGTGTTNTLPKWTSSTALGNSLITDDGTDVAVGGTSALRLPNGTTAERPGTPTAGMTRYNTTNGALEYYGASEWENPVRSASATGLGTATRVPFADANGRLTDIAGFTFTSGTGHLFIPSRLNVGGTTPTWAISNYTTSASAWTPWANSAALLGLTNTSGTDAYKTIALGNASQALALISSRQLTSTTGDLRFYTIGTFADPPDLYINPSGSVGIQNSNPSRTLHVTGEARITDLTTDTPTQIVGADADGDLGAITVGTGLSLSGGSLTASNLYNANGTLTDARTVTLGSNTLTLSGTSGGLNGVNFSMTPSTNTVAMQSLDGSLNNSAVSITPSRTQIVTTNVTGGTAATFSVFADSLTVTRAAIPLNDTLTTIIAMTQSGRFSRVTRSGLAGLADPGSNGILARTAANTTTARTITAGSGIAITNGDGVSGNPTISRTYSLIHTTITGGSTFFGTTAEWPDNDTPGSATTSTVGSDFSLSGSTIDYTGGSGALIRVQGSISFSVADDGDYYLSLYKEGTEIGATSMRISCVAGNYYSVSLPATTTGGSTNDTFDLRIATVSGNSTTTMHRYGFILERIY